MMDEIAKKLKKARKAKGLTQTQLGAKMGWPQSHISQIEAGRVDVRVSSLLEMARLLDLEPMFIPRALVPSVRSIISGRDEASKPAWQPDVSPEEEDLV
jgi:transcriptional regulator with XRE-family HTH domain